ncbi:MAG: PilZ domain-containing protein [Pseudomonadota bacterium]
MPLRASYQVPATKSGICETMNDSDNRQIPRDSLFIMAGLRVDGEQAEHSARIRNLSTGGLMAETSVRVTRGAIVHVNLRNLGWTAGTVAWVQDNRFGVAFREDIDPKVVRAPAGNAVPEAALRKCFAAPPPPPGPKARKLI